MPETDLVVADSPKTIPKIDKIRTLRKNIYEASNTMRFLDVCAKLWQMKQKADISFAQVLAASRNWPSAPAVFNGGSSKPHTL